MNNNIITYHDFCNFLKWLDYGYTRRSVEACEIIANSFEVVNFSDVMTESDRKILFDLFLNK